MLTRFACKHLLCSLGTLILHDCREVAVSPSATHKGLDVDLMEAGRACLIVAAVSFD